MIFVPADVALSRGLGFTCSQDSTKLLNVFVDYLFETEAASTKLFII